LSLNPNYALALAGRGLANVWASRLAGLWHDEARSAIAFFLIIHDF
jgi:hypothetical protein